MRKKAPYGGEARLDPKQYGFRPGRGCHDAIEMIYRAIAVKNAKREWVLDTDVKSAFDKIDHAFLLERIGTFPVKDQIRGWLKVRVADKGRCSPTDEGLKGAYVQLNISRPADYPDHD